MSDRGVLAGWRVPGTIGLHTRGDSQLPHASTRTSRLLRRAIALRVPGGATAQAPPPQSGVSPATRHAQQHPRTHFGRAPPAPGPATSNALLPISPAVAAAWPKASAAALQVIQGSVNFPELGLQAKPDWIPKVVKILSDEKIKRITFQIGSMVVDSTWFKSASEAFDQKLVPIIFDRRQSLGKASAVYMSDARLMGMSTGYIDDKFEKGVIVHECVHLAINRKGLQNVVKIENELVAHLAHAMYYHVNEWDRDEIFSRVVDNPNDETGVAKLQFKEPIEKAWDLAEYLLGKPPDKSKGEKAWSAGKRAGDDPATYQKLVRALRESIRSSPIYVPDIGKVVSYTSF